MILHSERDNDFKSMASPMPDHTLRHACVRPYSNQVRPTLITTTLDTLSKFLSWIPLGYVFETQLIQILFGHFWDSPIFRPDCIKCLNEIACLNGATQKNFQEAYKEKLVECFIATIHKLKQLPENHLTMMVQSANPKERAFWVQMVNQHALLLTKYTNTLSLCGFCAGGGSDLL